MKKKKITHKEITRNIVIIELTSASNHDNFFKNFKTTGSRVGRSNKLTTILTIPTPNVYPYPSGRRSTDE